MKKLLLLCSTAALCMPTTALAQSTGTQTTEEETIVVTGSRATRSVDGVNFPDSTKAKEVLTQEFIAKQAPGQTILNTINYVPSVNFTQSDAYGSAGGNIRIRGFDGNRISVTFDGVPLNDSGNYAIFSGQQLDPELIEQVNVNLGVTDVDSPTASAAGGTVNFRTLIPSNRLSARVVGSVGEFDYSRFFGLLQTGALEGLGTKGFGAFSHARNDKFKGPGHNNKWQFNGRIYQPLGSASDFISVSGHFNRNRNNFYRNPGFTDLRAILPVGEVPVTGSSSDPAVLGGYSSSQQNIIDDFENLAYCNMTNPLNGVRQNDNGGTGPNGTGANAPSIGGSANNNPLNSSSCTNYYGVRINPSNTGNIRGQSRFSITDDITLTIDPSYQYVLANGGGSTTFAENAAMLKGSNTAAPGVDLNGDGDYLDTIRVLSPNNTNTNRFGLLSSLIWDINRDHRVRVAYTYDRAHHRQTGEYGNLNRIGQPESVFGGRNGTTIYDAAGNVLQQRDRTSIALLNQLSGQYIGNFFDRKLRIEVGLRSPWFVRDLDQHCYTQTSGAGFATCTSQPVSTLVIVPDDATVFPANSLYLPFKAKYKYHKLLPNIGFTYRFTDAISMFGSYAKGFSAPRTDNLYRKPEVDVTPESTNAFDLGARYTTGLIQAQVTAWKIDYQDRIVTSFDPDLGISFDRNVGAVKSHGFEGSIAVKPIRQLTLLALASYTKAKFEENIQLGFTSTPVLPATVPAGVPIFAPTKGKMVAETPKWQYGGRAEVSVGPIDFGIQAKHVSSRFATDVNDVKVKGYTLVELDARASMAPLGLADSYFQLNVINLFDKYYLGNISTQVNAYNICPTGATCGANSANPNFAIGAPRTVMGSLNFGF